MNGIEYASNEHFYQAQKARYEQEELNLVCCRLLFNKYGSGIFKTGQRSKLLCDPVIRAMQNFVVVKSTSLIKLNGPRSPRML